MYLGLGSRMATFWERAAHSVSRMLSLYFVYLKLWLFPILVSRAGLGSDCVSSLSLLTFYFLKKQSMMPATTLSIIVLLHFFSFHFTIC